MIKENFLEAKTCFQNFLSQNNLSTDLVWLFYEDLIWQEKQFLINSKSILENEIVAENFYKIGQERDFGMAISAFCEFDKKIGCSIILPKDDLDAQYKMMSNEYLRYSFQTKLDKAKPIKNRWIWKIYKTFVPKDSSYVYKDLLLSKNACSFKSFN